MNKQEFKKRFNLTEKQYIGIDPIEGSLDLSSLTSITEGFNPTVGGSLYLSSLTSITEGFNPTVGGYLDLESLTSIPEGFDISDYENQTTTIFYWQNGKYISVDSLFCEVIKKKGNVFKCKKINQEDYFYIVTDGNGKYAHGYTIKEAKEDLIYKISERNKEDFKHLSLDSVLSFNKMIECYRTITGACSFGVKDFVESNDIKKKAYSIKEVIEMTENKHGNELFKQFFI